MSVEFHKLFKQSTVATEILLSKTQNLIEDVKIHNFLKSYRNLTDLNAIQVLSKRANKFSRKFHE